MRIDQKEKLIVENLIKLMKKVKAPEDFLLVEAMAAKVCYDWLHSLLREDPAPQPQPQPQKQDLPKKKVKAK